MNNTTNNNADDALLAKLGIYTFTTANGVPMSAIVFGKGDAATVAFYDVRYNINGYGQFITEYYISTLLESAQDHVDRGLALDGGIPAWNIDAGAYAGVIAFLRTIA